LSGDKRNLPAGRKPERVNEALVLVVVVVVVVMVVLQPRELSCKITICPNYQCSIEADCTHGYMKSIDERQTSGGVPTDIHCRPS
jgi:hypothetical protein